MEIYQRAHRSRVDESRQDETEQPQQQEPSPSPQAPEARHDGVEPAPTESAASVPPPAPPTRAHTGDFPDESTTGVPDGVALRSTGSTTVTEDGAVIDGLDVRGMITVRADDVTIKRTRIRTNGSLYGIKIESGTSGTLIEDVEIAGTDTDCSVGIVYGNYTARRVNVHGCKDGVRAGSNTIIEDSYSHSQRIAPGTHNDALQSTGGSNVRIVGNNLEGPFQNQTSAIIIQTDISPVNNVLIEGNLLSGGTYTLYIRDKETGHGPPTNAVVRNNVFLADSWKFGSHSLDRGQGFVWESNVDNRGRPVG